MRYLRVDVPQVAYTVSFDRLPGRCVVAAEINMVHNEVGCEYQ
jgi:hypothetical protein